MLNEDTIQHANSLDSLSHGPASSTNPFLLEDLAWEHFWIGEPGGELDTNRKKNMLISAANNWLGGLEGRSVLELGAYEGYHARILERYGASQITAIEGNPRNFLKCCTVKNHYQLNRTQYLLGDCSAYLDKCEKHYDLVVASGILYHLFDPIAALENISRLTDVIAICTTYYHPTIQGFKFTGRTKSTELTGLEDRVLYERLNPQIVKGKKHGMDETAWMFDFDTLLAYLELRDFSYEVLMRAERVEPFRVRTQILAHR